MLAHLHNYRIEGCPGNLPTGIIGQIMMKTARSLDGSIQRRYDSLISTVSRVSVEALPKQIDSLLTGFGYKSSAFLWKGNAERSPYFVLRLTGKNEEVNVCLTDRLCCSYDIALGTFIRGMLFVDGVFQSLIIDTGEIVSLRPGVRLSPWLTLESSATSSSSTLIQTDGLTDSVLALLCSDDGLSPDYPSGPEYASLLASSRPTSVRWTNELATLLADMYTLAPADLRNADDLSVFCETCLRIAASSSSTYQIDKSLFAWAPLPVYIDHAQGNIPTYWVDDQCVAVSDSATLKEINSLATTRLANRASLASFVPADTTLNEQLRQTIADLEREALALSTIQDISTTETEEMLAMQVELQQNCTALYSASRALAESQVARDAMNTITELRSYWTAVSPVKTRSVTFDEIVLVTRVGGQMHLSLDSTALLDVLISEDQVLLDGQKKYAVRLPDTMYTLLDLTPTLASFTYVTSRSSCGKTNTHTNQLGPFKVVTIDQLTDKLNALFLIINNAVSASAEELSAVILARIDRAKARLAVLKLKHFTFLDAMTRLGIVNADLAQNHAALQRCINLKLTGKKISPFISPAYDPSLPVTSLNLPAAEVSTEAALLLTAIQTGLLGHFSPPITTQTPVISIPHPFLAGSVRNAASIPCVVTDALTLAARQLNVVATWTGGLSTKLSAVVAQDWKNTALSLKSADQLLGALDWRFLTPTAMRSLMHRLTTWPSLSHTTAFSRNWGSVSVQQSSTSTCKYVYSFSETKTITEAQWQALPTNINLGESTMNGQRVTNPPFPFSITSSMKTRAGNTVTRKGTISFGAKASLASLPSRARDLLLLAPSANPLSQSSLFGAPKEVADLFQIWTVASAAHLASYDAYVEFVNLKEKVIADSPFAYLLRDPISHIWRDYIDQHPINNAATVDFIREGLTPPAITASTTFSFAVPGGTATVQYDDTSMQWSTDVTLPAESLDVFLELPIQTTMGPVRLADLANMRSLDSRLLESPLAGSDGPGIASRLRMYMQSSDVEISERATAIYSRWLAISSELNTSTYPASVFDFASFGLSASAPLGLSGLAQFTANRYAGSLAVWSSAALNKTGHAEVIDYGSDGSLIPADFTYHTETTWSGDSERLAQLISKVMQDTYADSLIQWMQSCCVTADGQPLLPPTLTAHERAYLLGSPVACEIVTPSTMRLYWSKYTTIAVMMQFLANANDRVVMHDGCLMVHSPDKSAYVLLA